MLIKLTSRDEQSVGGAVFQTSIQIGASIGTCLASLVSTTRAETTGDLARGLKDGFWMLTAFSWLGRSWFTIMLMKQYWSLSYWD